MNVELHQIPEKLPHALEFDEAVMTNMGRSIHLNNEGLVISMNPKQPASKVVGFAKGHYR